MPPTATYVQVSQYIGKPSLKGGWIIPRPPGSRHRQQLEEIERSSRQVRIRIRPDFKTAQLGNEIRGLAAGLQGELAATGKIDAIINYGNFNAQHKCYFPERRVFEDGKIYELSTRDAMHLLGSKPYMWAFEEYLEDSDLKPLIPESTATASSVNELQEQIRFLTDQMRAMQQQQQQAAASAKNKKRTLKDTLTEADAEAGEG